MGFQPFARSHSDGGELSSPDGLVLRTARLSGNGTQERGRTGGPMTARKIAVAVVLCGVALYFLVTWGMDWFRARDDEPAAAPEPEGERIEDARLTTTGSAAGAEGDSLEAWRAAFASADIPVGAVVSVEDFGDDADSLSVRQRGDVVACELRVIAHRVDLPPRTVAAYVGDLDDDFTLEAVTLLVRDKEASG